MFGGIGRNLSLLIGGIILFFSFGLAINAMIARKPWGVPDDRREDYERIVSDLQVEAVKKAKYQNADRPIAELSSTTLTLGMVQPDENCSAKLTLRNTGSLTMRAWLEKNTLAGLDLQLDPAELKPGGEATITVSGAASALQLLEAEQQEVVVLRTNDPLNESFELGISGEIATTLEIPEHVFCDPADPGEDLNGQFQIYSQRDLPFEVLEIRCDEAESFIWDAEKTDRSRSELVTAQGAKHVVSVQLSHQRFEYGRYLLPIEMDVDQAGQIKTYTTTLAGKIRSPISFKSPDLHSETGLNIGTISSTEAHTVHVGVSLRSEKHRHLEVLDLKPDELVATLKPLQREGLFQLAIIVPKDCKTVVFNQASQHGYVKVGDPQDPKFSSWFPLYGAVANDR